MSEKKYNPLDMQTAEDAQWMSDNYDYCFCVSKEKGESDTVCVVTGNFAHALQTIGLTLKHISERGDDNGKAIPQEKLLAMVLCGLRDEESTGNVFDFRKVVKTDGK